MSIPRNIRLAECPTHKKSIFEYAPESAGAVKKIMLAIENGKVSKALI
jgi:cellulose biosynthesis protein BcsQ